MVSGNNISNQRSFYMVNKTDKFSVELIRGVLIKCLV